jgi:hypothetical protein
MEAENDGKRAQGRGQFQQAAAAEVPLIAAFSALVRLGQVDRPAI